ncbi:MAG: gamma-glutamyltransferase [Gemmatimonadota bacterium]|nr:gamma-glutamyltransferase [Gemmatimonadota bacterium]
MDRRSFIQSSIAAGVVGGTACAEGSSPTGTDAGAAPSPTVPTNFPGRTGTPGERDWAAMSRVDMKPPQPIGAHVRVVGSGVMATTDHPYATEAALWTLERGGTAADAYITAALVQCVLEPAMTTLGGGFGVTCYDAATGELSTAGGAFAFPSGAPASEPYEEARSWTGFGAMVPGYVRGLEAAHGAYGRLSWQELWEPAIAFAENGFVIDHTLWAYTHHYRKMVGRFAGPGRDNWFRDGYILGVGDTVHLPELASTMTRLRDEGGDYFYTGPFARKLVDEVARRGGGITMDDLAAMQGFVSRSWKSAEPGGAPYRDYEIAPSSGLLFLLGLQVFEAADLRSMGRPTESVEALHTQIRVAQELWLRGADITPANQDDFISPDNARRVWRDIQNSPPRPFIGFAAATCGNVIVDAEGNVAAGTHSSSSEPFGTGINVDGVVMNRATYLRKYTNLPVGFSTQLWLFRDGRPALVMATPSRSLMECLLQGAANFVEYGMDGEQVVQAPRFGHPHPGIASAEIEGDFGDEAMVELEARGHALFPVSPRDANMGSIHAVRRLDDGRLEGVADPRRRGRASGGAVE